MAQKRRNGDAGDEMTGREKKKLKMSTARTIAIQPASQPGASQNAIAGPSTNSRPTDSMTGLPSAIDLEKFVEARAFEIDAMQTAMKTASASSTHRVWQTLPRHLRRRAASHDVRRVPLRLRDRARAEMDVVRKKALGRSMPKRGMARRVNRTDSFLKRQRNKTWLETHLWHAKRMHMENLWGYRLAVCPTEKAYRPSHRASVHGSILHDASYFSTVEIKGPEKVLISMLERFCDPQGPGPGSKRCLGGSRTLETHIYKPESYPYDLIAPLTILWRPLLTSEKNATAPFPNSYKSKGKAKEHVPPLSPVSISRTRCVWLRFHPSVHTTVFDILKEAASYTLAIHKAQYGDSQEVVLEIADLKGHLNVFEIMGPKSSQVIKGALSPVSSGKKDDFSHFWSSLTNLQSAGSVPRGMIIGFTVNDPRLNFPPKNPKAKSDGSAQAPRPNIVLPSANLAESDIWDERTRNGLAKPRFKKKDLDERRSKNEIPGTALNALRQDDRIPILLIQRSLESKDSTQALHGWTLIVPAGWSMAFFNSLVFTSTRVGGQRERQTQAYEAGTAYFPRDYPFTQSYEEWTMARKAKEQQTWERKPPAKRVNYEKLHIDNPWRADWKGLLNIAEDTGQNDGQESAFVSTQRESATDSAPVQTKNNVRPWLLRGSEVPKVLASMASVFNHNAALLSEINRLRLKRSLESLSNDIKPADLLQGGLINVKVTMCSRGSPRLLGMICSLSDDLARQWEKALHGRKAAAIALDDDTPQEAELANMIPSQDAIIGYITTGQFSLARGHGYGIGVISLTHLLKLEQQNFRLHPNHKAYSKTPSFLVAVQNIDSQQCRASRLEVLLD